MIYQIEIKDNWQAFEDRIATLPIYGQVKCIYSGKGHLGKNPVYEIHIDCNFFQTLKNIKNVIHVQPVGYNLMVDMELEYLSQNQIRERFDIRKAQGFFKAYQDIINFVSRKDKIKFTLVIDGNELANLDLEGFRNLLLWHPEIGV